MEGYRILLVDDEEELRAGIRRRIDWEALGFVLAGEAANGQDALELAEQLRPDVVLTDIKMPFMDGLTLCRQLKTQLPAVRLVIFSGFDEFDYARQAIGMNVFEYLLKPITSTELSDVLVRLKKAMDASGEDYRMLILPDHPTPIKVRTHVAEPVPYLLYDSTKPQEHTWHYNEKEAAESGNTVAHGWDMMKYLFS